MRTKSAGTAAIGADVRRREIVEPGANGVAGAAARLQKFAMHVKDASGPRPLMQIVDVLGDQRQASAARRQRRLRARQREVSGVGFRAHEIAPAQIIEREHRAGVAREGFRRCELHRIEARPDPLSVRIAKRAKPAFGRNPGAGQNEDVLGHGRSSRRLR